MHVTLYQCFDGQLGSWIINAFLKEQFGNNSKGLLFFFIHFKVKISQLIDQETMVTTLLTPSVPVFTSYLDRREHRNKRADKFMSS